MMSQLIPLLLLLYISNSLSASEVEETTLFRLDHVLSTEPTIFHYPKSDSNQLKIRHVAPRDVAGIPQVISSSPRPRYSPSFAPPPRSILFTPPLPPVYSDPFAGKPTLRGSNSEPTHGQRRPAHPPPARPPSPSFDVRERIPLPPPDFNIPEQKPVGKKALNTPSRPNVYQNIDIIKESLPKVVIPPSRHFNDTDPDLLSLPQDSVSRILASSVGRKPELPNLYHPGPISRHEHPLIVPPPPLPPIHREPPPVQRPPDPPRPPPEPPIVPPVNVTSENKTEIIPVVKVVVKKVENETVPPEVPPATDRETELIENLATDSELHKVASNGVHLWSIAWDVHVYLIASLFAVLAVYTVYNLIVHRFYKHLLPNVYFVAINLLIALIGGVRAFYLFHDAYNIGRSYPESVSRLLLNVACPLMTTAFATMFLFLVKTTEVWVASPLQHPLTLILVSLSHLALCVCLDVASDDSFDLMGRKYLPLVCQGVYIVLCILLGAGYLYMYKTLASTASRKQTEHLHAIYMTQDARRTRPVALSLAIRICLAIAMLVLLMAIVQVYGAVGAPEGPDSGTQRWLWWSYQFSVRVIEFAVCSLLAWAAMQRLHSEDEKETNSQNSTTGFAFPCGRGNDDNVDDIYPAVVNTNQAIHNYSLRTGKKVYDDTFPLNTMEKRGNGSLTWGHNYDEIGPGSEVIEVKDALTRKGLSTLNRSDSERSGAPGMPRLSGTLPGDRRRGRDIPTSTMLVAENGFVRFRSLAPDDVARRMAPINKSLPRRPHEPR